MRRYVIKNTAEESYLGHLVIEKCRFDGVAFVPEWYPGLNKALRFKKKEIAENTALGLNDWTGFRYKIVEITDEPLPQPLFSWREV